MEETHLLKLVYPSKKGIDKDHPHFKPLNLFKGVVLNLNEGALNCLNRLSCQEMQKNSPSLTLMEEYFLLRHYLDFIRRLCQHP
jgi:hypothetical protein